MGRLEDIVTRHEARKKMTSRKLVLIAMTVLIVVTLAVLMFFPELGMPKRAEHVTPAPTTVESHDHIEGVRLVRPKPSGSATK